MPGIMAISRALPVNETQLGAIDHMSKERMKDYKAVILEVTKTYHAAKMDVLATNAQLRKEEEEEVDFQPSGQLGASAGGGSSRGRGRGRGGKAWKGGNKRKRGGSQGGGGTSKRGRGGGYGRGGRGSRGGGGGGGSMGLPVPAVPSRGYR